MQLDERPCTLKKETMDLFVVFVVVVVVVVEQQFLHKGRRRVKVGGERSEVRCRQNVEYTLQQRTNAVCSINTSFAKKKFFQTFTSVNHQGEGFITCRQTILKLHAAAPLHVGLSC
jgi:hypothetical protein